MAFFKRNPSGNYVYYTVVESVRTASGPTHTDLLYIGRIDTLCPADRWTIEQQLAELAPSLIPDFHQLLDEQGYDFTQERDLHLSELDDVEPIEAVDYGPVRAIHSVSEKLGLKDLLAEHMTPKGGGPPLATLHLIMIYSRCLAPRSIAKTVDWYGLTALPELLDLPVDAVTYDALRNSLDYVPQAGIDAVHEALWNRTQKRYDTPDSPLHYDLTSSYFEGTEVPIAERGYSREHRPDRQQIVVGVTVNSDMVPLHHDVFPGSTNDSPTVEGVIQRIDELEVADPLIVGDKAVLTAPNRAGLRGETDMWDVDSYDYVAPVKRTAPIKAVLKAVERDDCEPVALPEGASPLAVTEIDPAAYIEEDAAPAYVPAEHIRWIVAFNEAKASDDAANRQETLEAVRETLGMLAENQYGDGPLEKTELLEQIDTAVPNALEDMVNWSVNERGQPRLSFEIDQEAVAEAAKLDGKALFETTRDAGRLSAESVCLAYRDRDSVESFIRTTKEITDLRPYHVRLEQKVRALVFFCVLGVHLIAALQLELEEAGLDLTGVKALEKLRGIRRVEMAVDGEEASVVKTTELSEEQAELLHVFEKDT